MPDQFFFYGTLMPQFAPLPLRELLSAFQFVGEGWAPGTLYDLGTYPGAVFDAASETKVFGKVLLTTDHPSMLTALDRYEGYDPDSPSSSEYLGKRLSITLGTGEQIECWVYEYNGSLAGASIIPTGRYTGA